MSSQVQHDLFGWFGMGLQKRLDQQLVDRLFAVVNLLVTARRFAAQLQAVQRALAGQRFLAHPLFPAQHRQQRILPQLVVIADVLVAECQRIHPLRDHLLHRVRNQPGLAPVLKATPQARQ